MAQKAASKTVEVNVSETVTVHAVGSNRTFFKGKAFVTPTEKKLIEREIDRLEEERAAAVEGDEESFEDEEPTTYTKTELNKMSEDELRKIAKDDMGLAFEETAVKADLVKLITDAQ